MVPRTGSGSSSASPEPSSSVGDRTPDARAGQRGVGTLDGKWTALTDASVTGGMGTRIAYAVATGSESGNLDFTTITSDRGGSITVLIRGYTGTPEAAAAWHAGTTTATSNPPSLTPSWGTQNVLWLAWSVIDTGALTVSTYPTSYGGAVEDPGTGVGGISYSLVWRELAAASDDPASFTWSGSASPLAQTVAVEGITRTPRHGFVHHNNPAIA